MTFNRDEICEVCSTKTTHWNIGENCILIRCPNCNHIKRDLSLCNFGIRKSEWGGSEFFDKVRAFLTILRLNKYLPRNKKLSVLEIGFGSGEILKKFIRRGFEVYGIESEN